MMNIKHYEKLEDQEIITRILKGETAFYELIIRRYNPYLFKVGRSYGFIHHDTEDLMQEAFISAYTNLSKFENRSSLKTWLVKIMLNHCYHKKQKASHKKEFASNLVENSNVVPMFSSNGSNTGKTVMNNELKHVLETALLKIPEDYKLVFTLRELNGMSTKETADALDITESNAKIRLKRAKNMLREEIEKMYSPEEIFEFNLIYCNRIVDNVFKKLEITSYHERKPSDLLGVPNRFFAWLKWKAGKPAT